MLKESLHSTDNASLRTGATVLLAGWAEVVGGSDDEGSGAEETAELELGTYICANAKLEKVDSLEKNSKTTATDTSVRSGPIPEQVDAEKLITLFFICVPWVKANFHF